MVSTMTKYAIKILIIFTLLMFLFLGLANCTQETKPEAVYVVSYGIFGKLGEARATFKKDSDLYKIITLA